MQRALVFVHDGRAPANQLARANHGLFDTCQARYFLQEHLEELASLAED